MGEVAQAKSDQRHETVSVKFWEGGGARDECEGVGREQLERKAWGWVTVSIG